MLIVDDNATNRYILELQLGSLRMRCAGAVGGREALEAMRRAHGQGTPFDLAILDMQMPEMDGLMLAREIKEDPALAGTRLVMLSSLGKHLDGAAFKAAGIEEYLVKPVHQSRLYDCLAEVMSHGEGSHDPGAEIVPIVPPEACPALPPARVLLAEDNMINQKVALRQLAKLGYQADAAADGKEVLEALKRIPYDIILMDCQMPELDGYDTTRRIRKEATRPIHIIAMTAHAMQGDREKCLAAGMDDYLTKPVQLVELHAALGRWRPAPTEASPVDLRRLNEAADGNPEDTRELSTIFIEQADEVMPSLEAALAAECRAT